MNAPSVSRAPQPPARAAQQSVTPNGRRCYTLITFQQPEVRKAGTSIDLQRSGVQKAETVITFQRPEVPKAETFIIFEAAWVSFKGFQHSLYSGEFQFKAKSTKPKQTIGNPA